MEKLASTAEIFPLVIAQGDAFCNRTEERELLRYNILNLKHTLLIAPRRYGKTSLANKVLTDLKLPAQCIDFFTITDEASIINLLYQGISSLVTQILPSHKNLLHRISGVFQRFNPALEVSLAGQKLKFQTNEKEATPEDIIALLEGLDKVAKEENTIAVLNIDEFQQIRTIKNHVAIEGAIRHALERSQHVMYLFSGSTRHILKNQFDDDNSPLFKSCHKCLLDRIHENDYRKHLANAAIKHWQQPLQDNALNQILIQTKCHSYYVNALASLLWRLDEPPTLADVDKHWELLARMEKPNFIQIVMNLSTNQRAMLLGLAKHPTTAPTSQEFLYKTGLATASANLALQVLLERDLVYLNKQNYFCVLDPLLEFTLK